MSYIQKSRCPVLDTIIFFRQLNDSFGDETRIHVRFTILLTEKSPLSDETTLLFLLFHICQIGADARTIAPVITHQMIHNPTIMSGII
jgi:hypothetical protein